MADNPLISQITLPSGVTYDIKDAAARAAIETIAGLDAINFKGVSTTALTDGGTENPTVGGQTVTTKKTGDLYFYGSAEFVWDGAKWVELGDLSTLGDLAQHDVADLEISATGVAEAQTFSGSEATLSVSINQGTVAAEGSYTPAGSVSATSTSSSTFISEVSPTSASYQVLQTAGSVTGGSAASFTQGTDSFEATVSNENLTLSFTQGTDTFTANVPTEVTLDSFQSVTLVTAVTSATSSVSVPTAFSFSGTEATISVSGSTSGVSAEDIVYTPAGTNSTSAVTVAGSAAYSA